MNSMMDLKQEAELLHGVHGLSVDGEMSKLGSIKYRQVLTHQTLNDDGEVPFWDYEWLVKEFCNVNVPDWVTYQSAARKCSTDIAQAVLSIVTLLHLIFKPLLQFLWILLKLPLRHQLHLGYMSNRIKASTSDSDEAIPNHAIHRQRSIKRVTREREVLRTGKIY